MLKFVFNSYICKTDSKVQEFMDKIKVLYITQETLPYTPENEISQVVRNFPQFVQEAGHDVRIFMPKYGIINERRHQLHEVIRLSGMNVDVNGTDHPVVIKVASLPQTKMQVYFIDNEEYFQRKSVFQDENEMFFADNDERAIFFCKGVLETIRKLGWVPDIIHCHGWMTSLIPMYIRTVYTEDPVFVGTKIIFSSYADKTWESTLNKKFFAKANHRGNEKTLAKYTSPSWINLTKIAAEFSDGLILNEKNKEVNLFAQSNDKAITTIVDNNFEEIFAFYEEVFELTSVTA